MSTFHSLLGIKNEFSENEKSQILDDDSHISMLDHHKELNSEPNYKPNSDSNLKSNSEPDPLDMTSADTNVHEKTKNMIKCKECNKYFNRKTNLKAHIDGVHRGLKKYDCKDCDKSFSQRSNLKTHINAVHEGMKQFQFQLHEKKFFFFFVK